MIGEEENVVSYKMVWKALREASPFECAADHRATPTVFGVDSQCVERVILACCGLDPVRYRVEQDHARRSYRIVKRDA